MGKTALITGANGISGGAILEYPVKNTTANEWASIIATSRSPFKTTVEDPRIKFVALDFSKSSDALATEMKDACAHVTHAYFCSYVHKDDFSELNSANEALFENFVDALEQVAPKLENITLQTGGKHYYVHLMPVPSPAREEEPRREGPIPNFYFPQEDKLFAAQKGKNWSWYVSRSEVCRNCALRLLHSSIADNSRLPRHLEVEIELGGAAADRVRNVIRPEAIIGATSKPNGMNEALTIAIYFLTCRELGTGAPMPTNQRYWEGTDDVSYAPLIADLTIYASTNANCANQAFNVTNGDYFSWKYLWPRLAEYFNAQATSDQKFSKPYPKEGDLQLELSLLEWSQDKRQVWEKLCEKQNLPAAKSTFDFGTWAFQDWVFQRTWSATLSMSKARQFGWNGYIDSYQAFIETFETFKRNGLIPV